MLSWDDNTGAYEQSEASVTITYWVALVGLAAMEERQGAFPGSTMALQGYRFVSRWLTWLFHRPRLFWQSLGRRACAA